MNQFGVKKNYSHYEKVYKKYRSYSPHSTNRHAMTANALGCSVSTAQNIVRVMSNSALNVALKSYDLPFSKALILLPIANDTDFQKHVARAVTIKESRVGLKKYVETIIEGKQHSADYYISDGNKSNIKSADKVAKILENYFMETVNILVGQKKGTYTVKIRYTLLSQAMHYINASGAMFSNAKINIVGGSSHGAEGHKEEPARKGHVFLEFK